MNMTDFMNTFKYGYVIEYKDNFHFSSTKVDGNFGAYRVAIPEDGDYTFSITQKHARMFPRSSGY